MPLVECRYAEALIDITETNCSTDAVLNDFNALISILDDSPVLSDYLGNPQIQKGEKKKLLTEVLQDSIDENLLRLLFLLVDKARTTHIKGILFEYNRFANEKKNVLNLKISSAVQLDELQVEKIKEKYAKAYKSDRVSTILEIDKSLIGGIKVQIGDRVEDYSIKSRLDSLKSLLMQD